MSFWLKNSNFDKKTEYIIDNTSIKYYDDNDYKTIKGGN